MKIRRPGDYEKYPEIKPSKPIPKLDISSVGIISTQVEDSPYKLFIGGLPHEMTEEQVKTMLNRFGKLKSFHLVKEKNDKNSKGYAFCEFVSEASTQACVHGLNEVTMGHRTLTVKRTGSGSNQHDAYEESKGSAQAVAGTNTYNDENSIQYFKSSKFLPQSSTNHIFSEPCCLSQKHFN